MAAEVPTSTRTPPPTESKIGRKKKAKAEAVITAEVGRKGSSTSIEHPQTKANGEEGTHENYYIKELHNKIRNINKKINALSKTEEIVKANPGCTLDDLVSTRKINADQKASIEKKPFLLSQLAQLEEQLSVYKKVDQDYQEQMAKEKELMHSKHKGELDQMRTATVRETEIEMQKVWKTRLLTFSRFLAAVARRRQEEDLSEEGKAFEAVLAYVYSGDPNAVVAAEKIIDGVEELVPGLEGSTLSVTYARIKSLSMQETPQEVEDPFADESVASSVVPHSDPTIANPALTEIDTAQISNGLTLAGDSLDTSTAPPSASIGVETGNAAAEEQWDTKVPGSADDALAESYEMVPRNPTETETPHQMPPTVSTQTTGSWADDATATGESSWAEDNQVAHGEGAKPAPPNATTGVATNDAAADGFQAVHHGSRGRGPRGSFRGDFRGRGRGDGRGRGGFRGDGKGRGRGRGEFRGRGREESGQ